MKCTQGDTYNKDCNVCTCEEFGIYVCSQKACYDGPQLPNTIALAESTSYSVADICNSYDARMKVSLFDPPTKREIPFVIVTFLIFVELPHV